MLLQSAFLPGDVLTMLKPAYLTDVENASWLVWRKLACFLTILQGGANGEDAGGESAQNLTPTYQPRVLVSADF